MVPVVSTFEHDDLLMQASLLSPRGTLGAYHCVVLLARSATNDRESRSDRAFVRAWWQARPVAALDDNERRYCADRLVRAG